MEWCRLYANILDDPVIGSLDDATFRTFMQLLMLGVRGDDGGNTHRTASDLDWAVRRNASVTLQILVQRKLVFIDENDAICVCDWDKWQKKGDSSAERVAKHRANRFDPLRYLTDAGVGQTVSEDWLDLRKRLKAPATETAISGIEREARKAGIALQEALQICCQRGWRGFNASWIEGRQKSFADKNEETLAKLTGRWDYQNGRVIDA